MLHVLQIAGIAVFALAALAAIGYARYGGVLGWPVAFLCGVLASTCWRPATFGYALALALLATAVWARRRLRLPGRASAVLAAACIGLYAGWYAVFGTVS